MVLASELLVARHRAFQQWRAVLPRHVRLRTPRPAHTMLISSVSNSLPDVPVGTRHLQTLRGSKGATCVRVSWGRR